VWLIMANENVFNPYKQPYILAQSGVPAGLAPNGTVATNGQITLGTALPRVYSSGIWLYLPAGAVVGGLSGLYWCVMSSTTVGQVYTKFADTSLGFVPYTPTGTLVNAVGSNASYTQATGATITLASFILSGGLLGSNGQLFHNVLFTYNTAAGTKLFVSWVGSNQLSGSSRTTAGGVDSFTSRMRNNGSQAVNTMFAISESSANSAPGALSQTVVDTSVNQTILMTANIDTATNYLILESFSTQVLPS
jgi:hypothetical protein